jgi:hypothetical protein
MKFEDIIHENLGHFGCGEGMLQGTKMSIFGKMINHHHDECLVVGFREAHNEIHRNIPPNRRGNWKGLECARGFDCFSLVALKSIKLRHKGADILFHTIPEKRKFDPFIGFGKP